MMSKRHFLNSLGLGGLASALSACNTLSLFNTITPKESSVHRVAQDVAYGSHSRQRYDVYAPRERSGPLPIVVFFYGGNWSDGSKDVYAWMAHALASMGYVVALPDYRLVPEVRYPDFLRDGADAVQHIVTHATQYGGHGQNLVLMGHSAGAYNAVMLVLDPQYLGKIPVLAYVGVSGPYDFYPFDVPASRDTFGQWPHPAETQPVNHVRKLETRFLLMQSRGDKIVGTHNAVNLAAKLKAVGTPVEVKLYDKLSHQDMAAAFSIPFRGKGPMFEDTKAFLEGLVFAE